MLLKNNTHHQHLVVIQHQQQQPKNQEDTINKRIKELDDIIAKKSGQPQARAETEKITKSNHLKKLKIYIIK